MLLHLLHTKDIALIVKREKHRSGHACTVSYATVNDAMMGLCSTREELG
jgi:hypothetical protein